MTKGTLLRSYTATCGLCFQTFTAHTIHNMNKTNAAWTLRSNGWTNTQRHGWAHKSCIDRHYAS